MGAGWQDVVEAVGNACDALVVVAFHREVGGWTSTRWHVKPDHAGLPDSLPPDLEQLVGETLREGVFPTSPTAGLGQVEPDFARQVETGVALAFDLKWCGPVVIRLGLPGPLDRKRVDGVRRLAQAAACQPACHYKQFFDNVPALFVAIDGEGSLVHCNDYISRLGYTQEELIGRPAGHIFAHGEWERLEATVREAPEAKRIKALLCHASGEIISMELLVARVPDGEGRPERLLSLCCDLRQEGQLGHHRRLEAVERMVSGVAHELNNPLQTVVGNAEMLAGMKLSESARRRAQRVLSGARRCQEVVDGLLKLKRKRRELAELVDVSELVRRSLRLVEAEFQPLKVAIRIQCEDDVPRIKGNIVDLEQALENVLRNAFQAVGRRDDPAVQIRIATTGETVQLTIEDNGPGLSPESLDRAFEPFFTTRGVGAGKGLGLSIALGIVQEHGGMIELQSSAEGARALIKLPLEGYQPY